MGFHLCQAQCLQISPDRASILMTLLFRAQLFVDAKKVVLKSFPWGPTVNVCFDSYILRPGK